jgi:hypothetical protein
MEKGAYGHVICALICKCGSILAAHMSCTSVIKTGGKF